MTKKPKTSKDAADKVVKNIRIVLVGLRGEESISVLCRREGIAESLYYSWSKEFLDAGKRRLSGDTTMVDIQTNLFQLLGHTWSSIAAEAETRLFFNVCKGHQIRPLSAAGWATAEGT